MNLNNPGSEDAMDDRFDRSRLKLLPLSQRQHDLDIGVIKPLERVLCNQPALQEVATRLRGARDKKAAIVLMMGAHVLRAGVQRYLIDLMERGWLSCIAVNGASVIHDFELALIGATTESVARYISSGQFGLWEELGQLNEIVSSGAQKGLGLGSAVGKAILEGDFPHKEISILAAGERLGIPVTAHVGIGYDIVYELPNCDGGAYGVTSYRDFLRFARILEGLEGGAVMSFGSAIMAPEVYLKALAMVRNVAHQTQREVRHFTTLVCDLQPLSGDLRREPSKQEPAYFFRPWKTMLARTVADGGESFYICGTHGELIPQLWSLLTQ